MSEYQCYEFLALDQPLTAKQMTELRAISTRAEISPTRFWNEYQWGSLKADPAKLMERYFDAHVYFANWGTHRLMLRMPRSRVDVKALKPYFTRSHAARFTAVGDHVVLDLVSDPEDHDYDEPNQGVLAALAGLRTELMQGDLRPAYLAWLLAAQSDGMDDTTVEPPLPTGLAKLTATQQAMVGFLRIDVDLVAAAAAASTADKGDGVAFRRWLMKLSAEEKDAWLHRAADAPELAIGAELLRTFRLNAGGGKSGARRTVGEIRALAQLQRLERQKQEAVRARQVITAAAAKRQRRLTTLGRDVDAAWAKVEKLVSASKYDEAVALAVDLRDLAIREKTQAAFAQRLKALRKRHIRRRGFFDRWKRANISESVER